MIIAIIGANGFIGSRIIEMFHLTNFAEVRPIVRKFSSLRCLARFDLDWRVADAEDHTTLSKALEGCRIAIDCTVSNPNNIIKEAGSVYKACDCAGVKRLIYLSSASVHGQSPDPGVIEETPLKLKQPLPYNTAKIRAEKTLRHQRSRASTELVIFRPGIVWGPRSRWVKDLADQLLNGYAYLLNGGKGICNSIYVDNLIYAIQLAINHPRADKEVFFVGDSELITWNDFYQSFAENMGFRAESIAQLPIPCFKNTWKNCVTSLPANSFMQRILPLVSSRLKRISKAIIHAWPQPVSNSPYASQVPLMPEATLEMTLLQLCSYKYPLKKVQNILGYRPIISFNEGVRRSVEWLKFLGYQANA